MSCTSVGALRQPGLLSRKFRRFIDGMKHLVSPDDPFIDSPELAGRTRPAPSSSPGTCCCWCWCWYWYCWCWCSRPGAAGGETERLLGCWVFATCSDYQAVCCSGFFSPLLRFLSGFVWILSVSCRELSRVSQNKAPFPPQWTLLRCPLFFFFSGRRSTCGWKRQWWATLVSLSPSPTCCGDVGRFFEKRISHWKGVKHRPPVSGHRLLPVLIHSAPSCGNSAKQADKRTLLATER